MRQFLLAVLVLSVGIGIVDPYACVQYTTGGSLHRAIPKRARARLVRIAGAALALAPGPPAPYTRQVDAEGDPVADEQAPWNDDTNRWIAPGTARAAATWIWVPPGDGEAESDAPPDLEVRVYVNAETGLPTSLDSVGGAPRLLALEGATAVEVAATAAGLPITPEEAAHAVTVIRIVVADPMTERTLRALADGRRPLDATPKPTREADRIESITVELSGAKHDVESLAAEAPVAGLRALLDR
jgi:hypothetical protein